MKTFQVYEFSGQTQGFWLLPLLIILSLFLAACGDQLTDEEARALAGGGGGPPPGVPGIIVTPTSGLVTSEPSGTATFLVVLNSEPISNVDIPLLSSSDPTEGTVSPATLTFTPGDWNIPQAVTVTGANDLVNDGDRPYTVITAPAVSADGNYNGLDPADVAVTNLDNEVTIVLNHTNRGYYREGDGFSSGAFSDTFTGWDGFFLLEFNSYFTFDLSGITGTVLTASLRTEIAAYTSGNISESFQVWDVTTPTFILIGGAGGLAAFSDLQTGINYGSFTVFQGDVGLTLNVPLNANAVVGIQALLGTFFSIGYHGITLSKLFFIPEWVRFSFAGESRIHQLTILVEQ